jgi:hypothetical protein
MEVHPMAAANPDGEPHKIETVWLREYANTYLPAETSFSYCPEVLRRHRLSLIDVRELFRCGRMVHATKLDEPGAIWMVEAEMEDGRRFRLEVHVISDLMELSLKDVEELSKGEDESHDAA